MAILVANTPETLQELKNILAGFDLKLASTMAEAETFINGGQLDICIVGVHFDDSQSVELMERARKQLGSELPIVAIRLLPCPQAHFMKKTMEAISLTAVRHLKYIEIEGNPSGKTELRHFVEKTLGIT